MSDLKVKKCSLDNYSENKENVRMINVMYDMEVLSEKDFNEKYKDFSVSFISKARYNFEFQKFSNEIKKIIIDNNYKLPTLIRTRKAIDSITKSFNSEDKVSFSVKGNFKTVCTKIVKITYDICYNKIKQVIFLKKKEE